MNSDVISRQDAIDALWKLRRNIQMMDNSQGADIVLHGVYLAEKKIQSLPSAEPNLQPTCNQLATDCISRQGAIDAVNELTRWYYETFHEKRPTAIAVIDKLMDLPSAEPEIIHCRDCKYYDGRPCGIVDWYNTDSDFCSRAERRTDE